MKSRTVNVVNIMNENSIASWDRDPPLNQLERLQRIRTGQAVLAPISVKAVRIPDSLS